MERHMAATLVTPPGVGHLANPVREQLNRTPPHTLMVIHRCLNPRALELSVRQQELTGMLPFDIHSESPGPSKPLDEWRCSIRASCVNTA